MVKSWWSSWVAAAFQVSSSMQSFFFSVQMHSPSTYFVHFFPMLHHFSWGYSTLTLSALSTSPNVYFVTSGSLPNRCFLTGLAGWHRPAKTLHRVACHRPNFWPQTICTWRVTRFSGEIQKSQPNLGDWKKWVFIFKPLDHWPVSKILKNTRFPSSSYRKHLGPPCTSVAKLKMWGTITPSACSVGSVGSKSKTVAENCSKDSDLRYLKMI